MELTGREYDHISTQSSLSETVFSLHYIAMSTCISFFHPDMFCPKTSAKLKNNILTYNYEMLHKMTMNEQKCSR